MYSVGRHHVGVGPGRLVVAPAYPELDEPQPPVQRLGHGVVGAYLQLAAAGVPGAGVAQQRDQQPGGDTAATGVRGDPEGLYVGLVVVYREPSITDDLVVADGGQIVPRRALGQLGPEQLGRPRVLGEDLPFQDDDVAKMPPAQWLEHDLADLTAPNSVRGGSGAVPGDGDIPRNAVCVPGGGHVTRASRVQTNIVGDGNVVPGLLKIVRVIRRNGGIHDRSPGGAQVRALR